MTRLSKKLTEICNVFGKTRKITIFAIIIILSNATCLLLISRNPSPKSWIAAADILKAEYFQIGPHGTTAQISEAEQGFFRISEDPCSQTVFKFIYDHGGNVAKAYAITGLSLDTKVRRDKRISEFLNSDTKINLPPWVGSEFMETSDLKAFLDDKSFRPYLKQRLD